MTALPPPEFSRLVPAEPLPSLGRTLTVDATPDERAALAARFGLERLERFSGTVTLRPLGARRGSVRVEMTGTLNAEAVRTCVVTLEPLTCHISETVTRRFSTDSEEDQGGDVDIDPDNDQDPPDPIVGGAVDVGETLAEAFGLALDPHPRAPGAELDEDAYPDETDDPEDVATPSPFAALAALKTGSERG